MTKQEQIEIIKKIRRIQDTKAWLLHLGLVFLIAVPTIVLAFTYLPVQALWVAVPSFFVPLISSWYLGKSIKQLYYSRLEFERYLAIQMYAVFKSDEYAKALGEVMREINSEGIFGKVDNDG